jgi:hypothetical protein
VHPRQAALPVSSSGASDYDASGKTQRRKQHPSTAMNNALWSVELGQGMGVLQLGATHDQVLKRLADAGIKLDEDDVEPDWIAVDDLDAELIFAASEPRLLREINADGERLRFGPKQVIGQRLHQVLDFLQVPEGETLWRATTYGELEAPQPATAEPEQAHSDLDLLRSGTLWIPPLGLGLEMHRGEVCRVRLRQPQDAPRTGIGPLTASQRALLAREDLADLLSYKIDDHTSGGSWYSTLLTLAFFAALALVVWRAIHYQQRWNATPIVQGEVIAVKPPPPNPFPDEFTVVYRDPAGQQHQAVLKRWETYGPHKTGEQVDLRFLPEDPGHPIGPSRIGDIAFETYLPWGIGMVGVYIALLTIGPLTAWLVRRVAAGKPSVG